MISQRINQLGQFMMMPMNSFCKGHGPDGISVKTARLYLPAVMSSSTTTISLPMIPAM